MRFILILTMLLASLPLVANAQADEQVVTIYFAGTNMTQDYWNETEFFHPFSEPETIATLYEQQIHGGNHHKKILDGFAWLEAALPDWDGKFSEAEGKLEEVIDNFPQEVSDSCDLTPCIILNLVGFSRGGASTLHFAHTISNEVEHADLKSKIKKINILNFDPVPGDAGMGSEVFNLPDDVEYLGFYSVDERTQFFAPVFPTPTAAHYDVFTVPGSHETMVGNIYMGGHRGLPRPLQDVGKVEAIRVVSSVLKIVATEVLGSSDWGHVRFNDDLSHPARNLSWYDGVTDTDGDGSIGIDELESYFTGRLDSIYTVFAPAPFYSDLMRRESFLPTLWREYWLGLLCVPESLPTFTSVLWPRCVYHRPGGYAGPLLISDRSLNGAGVPEYPLNALEGSDYRIWSLLLERGSLDIDEDIVDYNEDNCPFDFNPEQVNTDGDALGDICDPDMDGDGIDNESDNCPLIPNTDQANFDGDELGDVCDLDADNDEVNDDSDLCLYTQLGATVNASGCSIAQLVPCEGADENTSWKNHGQYVSKMAKEAKTFRKQGLINQWEFLTIMQAAAQSACGK
ncbi:thrombospondin type 3 repeat-containing protein [Shewanella canadensis]|nr:thrombospondin type 3 repeat-containing protein [Shewanella canadensis]